MARQVRHEMHAGANRVVEIRGRLDVHRHAQATRALVRLSWNGAHLELVVRDDGIGFSPAAVPQDTHTDHMGLIGIRERSAGPPGRRTRVLAWSATAVIAVLMVVWQLDVYDAWKPTNEEAGATASLLEDMPVADWDRVLNVNLRAVFLCTRVFIGPMLAQGWGRIINIASQLGQIGGIEAVHYSASKAGVIGLTKALAREFSHRGVLVNAIAPGPIQTPLLDGETEEWRSAKLAELPMRRFGTVAEVTPTAVLLASSDGDYYAGQTLGPNGGDVML